MYASFEEFVVDVGLRPSSKYSIERINNDGHYEIGNCRWATDLEQAANKRNVRKYEFDGVTGSLAELARRFGVDYDLIANRVQVLGWAIERAMREPKKGAR